MSSDTTKPGPRHLLNLNGWSEDEIRDLIRLGAEIKASPDAYSSALKGRSLALLFQKTSTRTRASFEIGMTQMGGYAMYMDWRSTNFVLSDLPDEALVLSRYVDGIVARMLRHRDLCLLAEGSEVPVVNGCCDVYHPCQVLGDLLTIQEQTGRLGGSRVTFVGVHNNVCNSLIEGCTKVGIDITVVAPEVNPTARDDDLLERAERTGHYKTTADVQKAVRDADFVYTDTWLDMEYFSDPGYAEEKQRRMRVLLPFQVNEALLRNTKARVMHCLPAHKGYEITDDVVNGPRSIVLQQAENRLHAQKALLCKLLER